jgi:predicted nucleotidyltransferase
MLNDDYKDILRILSDEKVKFILVGAYAMAAHGYLRATMDIDIWVQPEAENAAAVLRSLEIFGVPILELTADDLQQEGIVYQIGVAPRRIDTLTSVDGLEFEKAWANSKIVDIEGIKVHVLSIPDLIINKRSTGRTKDLADVETLEADVIAEGRVPSKGYSSAEELFAELDRETNA